MVQQCTGDASLDWTTRIVGGVEKKFPEEMKETTGQMNLKTLVATAVFDNYHRCGDARQMRVQPPTCRSTFASPGELLLVGNCDNGAVTIEDNDQTAQPQSLCGLA